MSQAPPDQFMLDVRARAVRRVRLRRRLALAAVIPTIAGTAWGMAQAPDQRLWILVTGLAVLLGLGLARIGWEPDPPRPRPDTGLEGAVVVGIEPTTWGKADGDGRTHWVRVIGRPLGSGTEHLVHGPYTFDAEVGCTIRPGMLFGFRRHPTMRHLVWIEPRHSPDTLGALRRDATSPEARPEPAVVESVGVADTPDGDWWPTTVTVRAEQDGRLLRETLPRLPEELAAFEAGQVVSILRTRALGECAIVPVTMPPRFDLRTG
ncbi:hypothetical protein [Jiangella muralis]|uniref:hypothetical protein n=1 Tax=Jiangella muralis TaxID=702383 RepID=UPI00069DAB11|nr:hypothetical protein [Jiangella muralis]